jgi:hypothetical protein
MKYHLYETILFPPPSLGYRYKRTRKGAQDALL